MHDMNIKPVKEIEVTMTPEELDAICHFIGVTSWSHRVEMGCTDAQAKLLTQIYDTCQTFLKQFGD
jgi:hypothetical protein